MSRKPLLGNIVRRNIKSSPISSTTTTSTSTTLSSLKKIFTGHNCLFVSPLLNHTLKIFMQVFFVVTFLSLFFFLYVVTVEKEIFNDQINMVVDALYGNMENSADLVIPQLVQTELKQEILDYLNTVVFSQQDYDDIRKQNEEVINTTKTVVYTFAVTLGACLFVIYFLRFCVDMTHHMIENLLALGAVALTEYLFLNLVSRNYIAANPNHVKLYFAERVFAYSQQKM